MEYGKGIFNGNEQKSAQERAEIMHIANELLVSCNTGFKIAVINTLPIDGSEITTSNLSERFHTAAESREVKLAQRSAQRIISNLAKKSPFIEELQDPKKINSYRFTHLGLLYLAPLAAIATDFEMRGEVPIGRILGVPSNQRSDGIFTPITRVAVMRAIGDGEKHSHLDIVNSTDIGHPSVKRAVIELMKAGMLEGESKNPHTNANPSTFEPTINWHDHIAQHPDKDNSFMDQCVASVDKVIEDGQAITTDSVIDHLPPEVVQKRKSIRIKVSGMLSYFARQGHLARSKYAQPNESSWVQISFEGTRFVQDFAHPLSCILKQDAKALDNFYELSLAVRDDYENYAGNSIALHHPFSNSGLSENPYASREKIVQFLQEHGEASNREIGNATGINNNTVAKNLTSLIREGKVAVTGNGTPKYTYRE